jgi:hypothetical protein
LQAQKSGFRLKARRNDGRGLVSGRLAIAGLNTLNSYWNDVVSSMKKLIKMIKQFPYQVKGIEGILLKKEN